MRSRARTIGLNGKGGFARPMSVERVEGVERVGFPKGEISSCSLYLNAFFFFLVWMPHTFDAPLFLFPLVKDFR